MQRKNSVSSIYEMARNNLNQIVNCLFAACSPLFACCRNRLLIGGLRAGGLQGQAHRGRYPSGLHSVIGSRCAD